MLGLRETRMMPYHLERNGLVECTSGTIENIPNGLMETGLTDHCNDVLPLFAGIPCSPPHHDGIQSSMP